MTPDQWKADAEGDFRRAVASVLHCWLENYTPKSRDEDHEPFVTVDCGALHVGWLTAKTKLSGPRPVAAGTPTTWTTLVADRIADGWPGTPTKGITVCGKDELAVLHAGRSKFDLVFIHLDEASDIEKAAEMCNLALFRFSRGGRIELRDVASIQAPECYFLSEAVGPKYLFPMIVALGNARNQARVLATAIESLRSQHPILNKLMPNPRGNQ